MKTTKRNQASPSNFGRIGVSAFALALLASAGIAEARERDQECAEGPALLGLVKRANGESLACLDSVTDGNKLRAVFLAASEKENANGGIDRKEAFVVLDAKIVGGSKGPVVSRQIRLANPELFPNGCGQYLKGARVLPGSEKFVAVYARKLRTVDFSNPKSPVIAIVNDRSIPGMASTCEGYLPNWEGGREDLEIDAKARTFTQVVRSMDRVEEVEPRKLSRAEDREFYRYAYEMECTGSLSEANSVGCQDLKRAATEGVYFFRKMVMPTETIVVQY